MMPLLFMIIIKAVMFGPACTMYILRLEFLLQFFFALAIFLNSHPKERVGGGVWMKMKYGLIFDIIHCFVMFNKKKFFRLTENAQITLTSKDNDYSKKSGKEYFSKSNIC